MRKIPYIYLFLMTVLALAYSCVREKWDEDVRPKEEEILIEDGTPVTIEGSFSIPKESDDAWGLTKAFVEKPAVQALYVAVFNAGDILTEVVKANPGTQSHPTTTFVAGEEDEQYITYFNVTLQAVQSGNRYVQFIAVSDTLYRFEGSNVDKISEATFVQDLITKYKPGSGTTPADNVVAYWGRKFYTYILPATSTSAGTNMKRIPMTRNFAKAQINVDDALAGNFKVYGFKVFDVPTSGTIAPFNIHSEDYSIDSLGHTVINFDRFAKFENASTVSKPYTYMTGTDTERGQQNYQGFTLTDVEYDDLSRYYDISGTDNVPWISPTGSDYLYECSYRPTRNPFMILKAKYSASTITTESGWSSVPYTYYKADFVYGTTNGNQYYHLLRNFLFKLNITGVNGPGSKTVYEAYNSIALNNFEASTMSSLLNNIANEDSYIAVNNTDILHTTGKEFTLYVKALTGDSGGNLTVNDNENITAEVRDSTSGHMIVKKNTDIKKATSDETSGIYSGWRKVTVTVAKDPDDLHPGEVWKQPIVFKNSAGLTRTVYLTMRKPFSLSVDVQDYVAPVKGEEVTVDFNVPAGLTSPRFPIFFYLEQEDNTLYPKPLASGANETLSVESGPTLIPGHVGNNYYYKRTISWEEYSAMDSDINGIKTFRCYFLTMVPESATTVWVVAAPENDYYYPVDDANDSTNRDTFANEMEEGNIYFSYYGMQVKVNGTASNPATSNAGAPIYYSSSNTAVAKVDGKGNVTGVSVGNAVITATSPTYKNYTAADPIQYTVNVTADSLSNLTAKWIREPVFVVKAGSTVQTSGTYTIDTRYTGTPTVAYSSSDTNIATVANDGTVTGVAPGYALITYTVEVPSVNVPASENTPAITFAATSQSISYEIQVIASSATAASGTIHHQETFLGPTMGDYQIAREVVTDGDDWQHGNDVTSEFLQYTWFSGGSCYRHVWYPYYTPDISYGVAQSAWGAIEPATKRYNPDTKKWDTDYHNARFSAYSQIVSPVIDLSTSAGASLTFYHAGNYFDDPAHLNSRANMKDDAHLRFSKDGGTTWSAPVDINYPPGTNWIYIKAKAVIPTDYLVSNFRLAFDCVSYKDHFSRLYYTNGTSNTTSTTVTEWPVFYDAKRYDKEDPETHQPVIDPNTNQPETEIRLLTTYVRGHNEGGTWLFSTYIPEDGEDPAHWSTPAAYESDIEAVVLANPVWKTNDDGRAGTWEIKNLMITEN